MSLRRCCTARRRHAPANIARHMLRGHYVCGTQSSELYIYTVKGSRLFLRVGFYFTCRWPERYCLSVHSVSRSGGMQFELWPARPTWPMRVLGQADRFSQIRVWSEALHTIVQVTRAMILFIEARCHVRFCRAGARPLWHGLHLHLGVTHELEGRRSTAALAPNKKSNHYVICRRLRRRAFLRERKQTVQRLDSHIYIHTNMHNITILQYS